MGAHTMKRTPVKKVNRKRRAESFKRCYGSKARVAWVKTWPCFLCGTRPSENAHTQNGGMGRKADYTTIVPLCHTHHARLDAHEIDDFAWTEWAVLTEFLWKLHTGAEP